MDGKVLPAHPFKNLRKIPMIVGCCGYEAGFFTWAHAKPILTGLFDQMRERVGEDVFDDICFAYKETAPDVSRWKDDLFADLCVGINSYRLVTLLSEMGAPVWLHRFNYEEATTLGPIHTSDIPFAFNAPGKTFAADVPPWTEEQAVLAWRVQQSFANFAKSGAPSAVGLPEWPVFDALGKFMSLDALASIQHGFIAPKRVDAWRKVDLYLSGLTTKSPIQRIASKRNRSLPTATFQTGAGKRSSADMTQTATCWATA